MVILVVEVMMNDGDHCGGGPVKESPERDTGSMGVQVNMSLMSVLYQLLRNDFRIRRSQEIHGHDQGIVLVPWRRNEQQNSCQLRSHRSAAAAPGLQPHVIAISCSDSIESHRRRRETVTNTGIKL